MIIISSSVNIRTEVNKCMGRDKNKSTWVFLYLLVLSVPCSRTAHKRLLTGIELRSLCFVKCIVNHVNSMFCNWIETYIIYSYKMKLFMSLNSWLLFINFYFRWTIRLVCSYNISYISRKLWPFMEFSLQIFIIFTFIILMAK